jgi:hypothetical protein
MGHRSQGNEWRTVGGPHALVFLEANQPCPPERQYVTQRPAAGVVVDLHKPGQLAGIRIRLPGCKPGEARPEPQDPKVRLDCKDRPAPKACVERWARPDNLECPAHLECPAPRASVAR